MGVLKGIKLNNLEDYSCITEVLGCINHKGRCEEDIILSSYIDRTPPIGRPRYSIGIILCRKCLIHELLGLHIEDKGE